MVDCELIKPVHNVICNALFINNSADTYPNEYLSTFFSSVPHSDGDGLQYPTAANHHHHQQPELSPNPVSYHSMDETRVREVQPADASDKQIHYEINPQTEGQNCAGHRPDHVHENDTAIPVANGSIIIDMENNQTAMFKSEGNEVDVHKMA